MAQAFSKAQLVETVAARTGLTQVKTRAALDTMLDLINEKCAEGSTVRLTNFGSFTARDLPARAGRDPRTGEAVAIPAKRVMRFKPVRKGA
jgi:nucleoid DNA-binding protein